MVPSELREKQESHHIADANRYTTTLGLVWNSVTDELHVAISELPFQENITKKRLVSDIAKVFDALGWLSPSTTKMKILLQQSPAAKTKKEDTDEEIDEEIDNMVNPYLIFLFVLDEQIEAICTAARSLPFQPITNPTPRYWGTEIRKYIETFMISKGAELVTASPAPTIPLMAPIPHNQAHSKPYILGVYRFKTVPEKDMSCRLNLCTTLVQTSAWGQC